MEKDPNLDQQNVLMSRYQKEFAEKAGGAIICLFFSTIIPSLTISAIRFHSNNSPEIGMPMADWRTAVLSLLTMYGTGVAAINCFDLIADLLVLQKKIKVLDK